MLKTSYAYQDVDNEVTLGNLSVNGETTIKLPCTINVVGDVSLNGGLYVKSPEDFTLIDCPKRLNPLQINTVKEANKTEEIIKSGKLIIGAFINGSDLVDGIGSLTGSNKIISFSQKVDGSDTNSDYCIGDTLFYGNNVKITGIGEKNAVSLTGDNLKNYITYDGVENAPNVEQNGKAYSISGPSTILKFESQGGNCSVKEKKIYQGNVYGELPMPTRTGCTFLGWFTQPVGGDQVNASTPAPTEITVDTPSIIIYAHWATTINYVLDGGTNSPENPEAFETGDSYVLANPTKTGYTFLGWFTQANGAGEKIDKYDASVTATTLYAYWQANKYTIEYKINNENAKGSMIAQSMTYGVSATLTNVGFTCDKATFIGWNTSADGNGNLYVNKAKVSNLTEEPNGTVTLYAQWKPTTYNIKYDANASSVGGKATGKTANSKFTFFNLENKTNINGYKIVGANFLGWNTRADGNGEWFGKGIESEPAIGEEIIGVKLDDLAGKTNATVTLYAIWQPIDYTVNVYLDADMFAKKEKSFTLDMTYGMTIPESIEASDLIEPLVKNGYTLSKYAYKDANGKEKTIAVNGKNLLTTETSIDIYGVWTVPTYKVSYNLNGGKNASKNPKSYKTTDISKVLLEPTRKGYTFDKWIDASVLEGKSGESLASAIADAEAITEIATGSYGNRNLYAVWKENQYTIIYHTGDGDSSKYLDATQEDITKETVAYKFSDKVKLFEDTANFEQGKDYKLADSFKGQKINITTWTTAPKGKGTKYIVGKPYSGLSADDNAEVHLYASYNVATYEISYNLADDEAFPAVNNKSNPYYYAYNEKKSVSIKAPSRPGYVFEKWIMSESESASFDSAKNQILPGSFGKIELVAKWIPIQYKVSLNANAKTAKFDKQMKLDYVSSTEDESDIETNFNIGNTEQYKLTNPGYTLTGFNTAKNGKGISVDIAKNGTVSILGLTKATSVGAKGVSVVLYAQWSINQYQIRYVDIDPSCNIESLEENEPITELGGVINKNATSITVTKSLSLKNPTRYGFTFLGYYKEPECINKVTKIDKGTTENITLYGKWKVK